MAKNCREKSSFKTAKMRENVFYWLMIALPLLQFITFYIIVNANSFLLAFKSYSFNEETLKYDAAFVGFKNFEDFFNNFFAEGGNLVQILKNSLILYAVNLFIGTVFALLFSYYIYKKRFMSKVFRVVLFLPSIISSIVFVTIYGYFVDMFVPGFLRSTIGVNINPLTDVAKFPVILFYNVFIGFGTSVLMYSGAMSRVPDGVIEAGMIDGVGPMRELCVLVLPLISSTVATFLITGVAGIFINEACITAFDSYTAREVNQTFGYYLLVLVKGENTSQLDYPYASAAGLSLALIAVPVTLCVKRLLDKIVPDVEY